MEHETKTPALGAPARPRAPKARPAEPAPVLVPQSSFSAPVESVTTSGHAAPGDAYGTWIAAVEHLATARADVMALAETAASIRRRDLLTAREARGRIDQWPKALQGG